MAARYPHPVFLSQALRTQVKPLLDLESGGRAWTGLASQSVKYGNRLELTRHNPIVQNGYDEELLKSQFIYIDIYINTGPLGLPIKPLLGNHHGIDLGNPGRLGSMVHTSR